MISYRDIHRLAVTCIRNLYRTLRLRQVYAVRHINGEVRGLPHDKIRSIALLRLTGTIGHGGNYGVSAIIELRTFKCPGLKSNRKLAILVGDSSSVKRHIT